VCDSGVGIAADQQCSIFGEFYQVPAAEGSGKVGLGLGLAIVERLCAVLDHPIGLTSTLGKGSRFSVTVPRAAARAAAPPRVAAAAAVVPGHLAGRLVVVIDDDALALEGTRGLLRSWGCQVVAASSDREVLAKLNGKAPDLIISDYHLQDGRTGIEAIAALRAAFGAEIPAFLVSGDITRERLSESGGSTHHLLHKPVNPMALRAIMSGLLKR
jgi:CheY-like chemotaxis protein